MTVPNYGDLTVCRPLVANVPHPDVGWERSVCPYCGEACWITPMEPRPLPVGVTAACTLCTIQRGADQREMDRLRFEREERVRSPDESPPTPT
jgi:hypothetical protein